MCNLAPSFTRHIGRKMRHSERKRPPARANGQVCGDQGSIGVDPPYQGVRTRSVPSGEIGFTGARFRWPPPYATNASSASWRVPVAFVNQVNPSRGTEAQSRTF